jgi:ribonucleoside-diphosphate reductase alpha chain
MRVAMSSPICELLKKADIPNEVDTYSDNTQVFEFPIDQGKTRIAKSVTAWEQFALLAMLQREWADNQVSCSIYFDEESDGPHLESMLSMFMPVIKSVSMLPHSDDGAYEQMPYQAITHNEYKQRLSDIGDIDWSGFGGSDGLESRFCTDETCEL